VVALFILYLFLQSSDFVHAFENVMIFFVVWISPWAAITLVDFFLLRRGSIDIKELYRHHADSACGDINWRGVLALVLGVISAWLFQVGTIESMQGPVAMALGGLDLSWLAGFVVAGGSYFFLHPGRKERVRRVAMTSE
jgi:nucleobase:cation symporter-1, NCS1 family